MSRMFARSLFKWVEGAYVGMKPTYKSLHCFWRMTQVESERSQNASSQLAALNAEVEMKRS